MPPFGRARPALCALLVALVALSAAAPASARVPREWIGVMADGPLLNEPTVDVARELRLMRGARVGSVRVAFYWADLERQQGRPDLSGTDMVVLAAARQRLRVLPVVVRAPAWAAVRPGEEGSPPRRYADYGRFLQALVRRYGPRGTLWRQFPGVRPMPIRRWQVWNEPDIERYWTGKPWHRTYVGLLRVARRAIRSVDGRGQVVLGGLTNRSWEELPQLYRAGARPHFDVAAIHPFSRRPSNVLKIVRLARRAMARHRDGRTPLLLTEVSWSSGKGRSSFNYGWETTERGQADRIRQALPLLARHRKRYRIAGLHWYTWLSPKLGDDESFSYAGLRRLRADGTPVSKPAYGAFKSVTRKLRD